MTSKTKTTLKVLGLGLLAVPAMFAFTACGGGSDLDQKAVCSTNKSYTTSTAAEFNEKTTGDSYITWNAGGYRLTVEANAEGCAGPEGHQTKYYLNLLSNAAIRLGGKKEDNQLGMKTTMNCDLVGLKANITTEAYVVDGNLYAHTYPTTIETGYTKTEIAEQKIMVEGITADYAMTNVGEMDVAYDQDTIMDFIKKYQDLATFQISENGNDIGFKVVFNNSVAFGEMTNIVAYVNVDARYANNPEVSNGYMIKELRIEGDYSTSAGSGSVGGSISMTGRMSVTISAYWGDSEGNVIHPNFNGYKAGSISDIGGLTK